MQSARWAIMQSARDGATRVLSCRRVTEFRVPLLHVCVFKVDRNSGYRPHAHPRRIHQPPSVST